MGRPFTDYHSQKRGIRGLSLLEVLLAMVLIVLVVTSFAVIYPSGFRLHRKNQVSTQASQAARTLLSELKSLPLTREDGGLSLAYLAINGYSESDSVLDGFPRTELPQGFQLSPEKGIEVILYDLANGSDPSVFASMRVTVMYSDPYGSRAEPLAVTLAAGKSWNR